MLIKVGVVSYSELETSRNKINALVSGEQMSVDIWNVLAPLLGGGKLSDRCGPCTIDFDPVVGCFRLYDATSHIPYVRLDGKFPYTIPDEDHPAPSSGSGTPGGSYTVVDSHNTTINNYYSIPESNPNCQNKWISISSARAPIENRGQIDKTFTYDDLVSLADVSNRNSSGYSYSVVLLCSGFYALRRMSKSGGQPEVLANRNSIPFVATKSESTAADQIHNYYEPVTEQGDVVEGDKVEVGMQIIDSANKTVSILENGVVYSYSIDQLLYDFSTDSYYVDVWNITNTDDDTYVTNDYTYNVQYNISNTYVTYIGGNDAWQQTEYLYYYELPDGRSSADLTADEIAALSFQFYDCMNYTRSATDSSLRALFHFDGDTHDSGFYSTKTSFEWKQGASITYMDSASFDGALYLDERSHEFDIVLPSSVLAGQDFTLQYRYYQASQPDTQNNIENYLSLGGNTVLKWDERNLYYGNTNIGMLPVGNWSEIALVRQNGTFYIYLNGVKIYSFYNSGYFQNSITFHLGDTSRAYSMLDELRVLNFALAKAGSSYTPTAVPFDSNLVLVLPGTETVTDLFWQFESEGNLLSNCDFSSGTTYLNSTSKKGEFFFQAPATSARHMSYEITDSCLRLSGEGDSSSNVVEGLCLYLGYSWNGGSQSDGGFSDGDYCFTVVDSSGELFSFTFTLNSDVSITPRVARGWQWGTIGISRGAQDDYGGHNVYLTVKPLLNGFTSDGPFTGTLDIVYLELVQGRSSSLTAEKVSCQYKLSDLIPNTAAVHTDIPIHGYTVGGVRPTFPVRGDVWMMVTAGRVSSVQVYNGSAWEASNARYWTGSRWIPIYAFDIFTLEDCWDVADTDDVITQITTESGFWNWWKGQWMDFRTWLSGVFGGGSGGSDPDDPAVSPSTSPSPSAPSGGDDLVIETPGHPALAPYVSIVRENSDNWERVDDCTISVTMERGDLWQGTNTSRNMFLFDVLTSEYVSGGNAIVSLDINGLPVTEWNQWDSASFLCYVDDDNYVSVGRKCQFDGFATVTEFNGVGTEQSGNSGHNTVVNATFVFIISDRSIAIFGRPEGGGWVSVGNVSTDNLSGGTRRLGFAQWCYHDRGKSISFSNLRVGDANSYSADDLDSFLRDTAVLPFFVEEGRSQTSFFDILGHLKDAAWSLVDGFVTVFSGGVVRFFLDVSGGVTDFFGSFNSGPGLFGFYTYEGEDLWD